MYFQIQLILTAIIIMPFNVSDVYEKYTSSFKLKIFFYSKVFYMSSIFNYILNNDVIYSI